jgi:hypothetical protein
MSHLLVVLEMPGDLEQFKLPAGVSDRLQELLDRQDRGETLTPTELEWRVSDMSSSSMNNAVSTATGCFQGGGPRDRNQTKPRWTDDHKTEATLSGLILA